MTIGIISDCPVFKVGMQVILNRYFDNVDLVTMDSDRIPTLSAVYAKSPDIVIVAIRQNSPQGPYESIYKARLQSPAARIIVYEESIPSSFCIYYFRFRIQGYIASNFTESEIVNCVTSVLQQGIDESELIAKQIQHEILVKNAIPTSDNIPLTFRELEIAKLLIQGITTNAIALILRKKPTTISSFKNKILRKVMVKNVVSLREVFIKYNLTESIAQTC